MKDDSPHSVGVKQRVVCLVETQCAPINMFMQHVHVCVSVCVCASKLLPNQVSTTSLHHTAEVESPRSSCFHFLFIS